MLKSLREDNTNERCKKKKITLPTTIKNKYVNHQQLRIVLDWPNKKNDGNTTTEKSELSGNSD